MLTGYSFGRLQAVSYQRLENATTFSIVEGQRYCAEYNLGPLRVDLRKCSQ